MARVYQQRQNAGLSDPPKWVPRIDQQLLHNNLQNLATNETVIIRDGAHYK